MKSKELMINDWVQDINCTTPSIVAGVTQGCIDIRWIRNTSIVKDDVDCNPIPLTREILEKNGFVLNKFGEYENGAVRVIPATNKSMFSNIDHNVLSIHESGHLEVLHIRCDYVHTMQHALRLCGMNDMADNLIV